MMINKIVGVVVLALVGTVAHAKILDTEETAPQGTTQQGTVTQSSAIKPAQKVSGFYLGMGVGNTRFDIEDEEEDDSSIDTDGNTLRIIAGYQFNRVFALEAQYIQYGDVGGGSDPLSPTSYSVAANLGYTFKNGIRPFGVIGLSNADLNLPEYEYEDLDEGDEVDVDGGGVGVHLGLGLEYAPVQLKGFSARLGYEVDLNSIESEYYDASWDHRYIANLDYTLGSFYVAATYKF